MRFECKQKTYVMCNTGALGDTCATFPYLKKIADRGQIEKLFVQDNYYSLYELVFGKDILVNIKENTEVEQFTGKPYLKYKIDQNIPIVDSLRQQPSSIHMHLVDCFSSTIGDCILKENDKDYPLIPKEKLPENPVKEKEYVVLAYGATTEHRKMLPEVFEGIKKYFLDKNIQVVLLGKKDHNLVCVGADNGNDVKTKPTFEGVSFEGCIDLIDKTSIPEALSIISDAKMIIGLDNGLIHLAGLTDCPIVAGYTTVDPYYRLPYRHGEKGQNCFVVEPTSGCKYCQTENYESYGINFLKCNIMTKECMNSLTLEKWIEQIEKVL